MKKLSLPSGATGFTNDAGQWVCTGSQMGRRNVLPENRSEPCNLRLMRLRLVDGAYDQWGAYWGSPANVYCAWGEAGEVSARVFVRAVSRVEAKAKVRKSLPAAKFYN